MEEEEEEEEEEKDEEEEEACGGARGCDGPPAQRARVHGVAVPGLEQRTAGTLGGRQQQHLGMESNGGGEKFALSLFPILFCNGAI
eukprot:gene15963-biopygen2207